MKTENTLFDNCCVSIRKHRWLIVAVFAALLAGLELTRYTISARYEFDQAYRLLLFGVALPLLVGTALSMPSGFERTRTLAGQTNNQIKRRVLVATNEMLLGAGIESLLVRKKELHPTRVATGSHIDLIKKISRLKPEIVILDEVMYRVNAGQMLAFLDDRPEMRLVIVSTNENRIQVYNKQQIMVTQSSTDLVEMMCRT